MRKVNQHRVAIVGAGGNIGSHLCEHIARIPTVGSMVLIDPDHYEPTNLTSQNLSPWEVGRPKAKVQAERLARLRSDLRLAAFCAPVESVPWGELEGDVILACPDSLAVRLHVNRVAWRLEVPWVDAGVRADGWLARVSTFRPEAGAACLECSLEVRDYETAAQTQSCFGERRVPPTRSPSSLGALAASLQALECLKILSESPFPLWGRQVLIEAAFHHHYVTRFRANPHCRFDHQIWSLRPLRLRLAEESLQDLIRKLDVEGCRQGLIRVAGQALLSGLVCLACGREVRVERLEWRIASEVRTCPDCRARMEAPLTHRNSGFRLPPGHGLSEKALAALGLRDGDLLLVESDGRTLHYRIQDTPSSKRERTVESDYG